ncbi:MAG: hypothetical protein LUG13_02925 [Oscillospiraceae bacterium]|nr:hypothetical protein [Oscillospiraceae bacterium]
MRQLVYRAVSILLVPVLLIALCIGMGIPARAEGDPQLIATLDKSVIQYSEDEDQYITMDIALDQEVSAVYYKGSFMQGNSLDLTSTSSSLQLSSAVAKDWPSRFEFNNTLGTFENYSFDLDDVETLESLESLVTCAILVPAGTPVGEYTVGAKNVSVSATYNGPLSYIIRLATVSTTFTIQEEAVQEPEPTDPGEGSTLNYSIALTTDSAVVNPGDTFDVDVTINGDEDFDAAMFTVTYDTSRFAYVDATWSNKKSMYGVNPDAEAGTIKVINCVMGSESLIPIGETMITLQFRALDVTGTTDSSMTVSDAEIETAASSVRDSAVTVQVTTTDLTMTVSEQYTVSFYEQDSTLIGSYTVGYNGKLGDVIESLPAAASLAHYDFIGWSTDGENATDDILNLPVTSNVSYTALYAVKAYAVSLVNDAAYPAFTLSGAATATYDAPYTVTLNGYDDTGYLFTVTYAADGAVAQTAVNNGDGTFTIPAGGITGDVTITLTVEPPSVAFEIVQDYVTGYSLLLISGDQAAPYSYDGNPMYWVEAYDAFAYLIDGTYSETEVAPLITANSAGYDTIERNSLDVNADNTVGLKDLVAASTCYSAGYAMTYANIYSYLTADVNADYVVNATDVGLIFDAIF